MVVLQKRETNDSLVHSVAKAKKKRDEVCKKLLQWWYINCRKYMCPRMGDDLSGSRAAFAPRRRTWQAKQVDQRRQSRR